MQDHKLAADFRDQVMTSLDNEDKLRDFGGAASVLDQTLAKVVSIHAWNPQVAAVFFDNGLFLVAYKMAPQAEWQVAQTDRWAGDSPADPFDMDSMDPGDHVERVEPKFFLYIDRDGRPTPAGRRGAYFCGKSVSLPTKHAQPKTTASSPPATPKPGPKPTGGAPRSASQSPSPPKASANQASATADRERSDTALGCSVTAVGVIGLLVVGLACAGMFGSDLFEGPAPASKETSASDAVDKLEKATKSGRKKSRKGKGKGKRRKKSGR